MRRAGSPVIHWLSPVRVAMRPSRVEASFSVTNGRPNRTRLKKPAFTSSASAASNPSSTTMPAARSRAMPGAVHPRVGIARGDHHARHAGGDQGVGAGRGAAMVAAGLQRDVDGGAARRRAGHGECQRLGMRPSARRGDGAADHAPGAHHHAADGGVWPGIAQAPACQGQGCTHM